MLIFCANQSGSPAGKMRKVLQFVGGLMADLRHSSGNMLMLMPMLMPMLIPDVGGKTGREKKA